MQYIKGCPCDLLNIHLIAGLLGMRYNIKTLIFQYKVKTVNQRTFKRLKSCLDCGDARTTIRGIYYIAQNLFCLKQIQRLHRCEDRKSVGIQ